MERLSYEKISFDKYRRIVGRATANETWDLWDAVSQAILRDAMMRSTVRRS
jgi:hypothetical protein